MKTTVYDINVINSDDRFFLELIDKPLKGDYIIKPSTIEGKFIYYEVINSVYKEGQTALTVMVKLTTITN